MKNIKPLLYFIAMIILGVSAAETASFLLIILFLAVTLLTYSEICSYVEKT